MDKDSKYGAAEDWAHGGARALVRLHEQNLRSFLATWKRAKAGGVSLPKTDDPAYASMEALLFHMLRAARGYFGGLCGMLEIEPPALPDPPIPDPALDPGSVGPVEAGAQAFLDELLHAYRTTFRGATEEEFYRRTGEAPWKVVYCVDAMFEHAVMHPIRHSLQLDDLLANS